MRTPRKVGALLWALAVVAGCGDDNGTEDGASTMSTTAATSDATDSSDAGSGTTPATDTETTSGDSTGTPGDSTGATFDDDYFEMLVARPEHHSSTDLGSAAEVDAQVEFSDPADSTTEYDPAQDAAKFTVPANSGSIIIGDQVRHSFDRVSSGSLLFFWEARASAYWAVAGDVDGVQTYKAFQLSDNGDLTLEPRFRFDMADPPYFARTDMRVYGSQTGVDVGPADSVAPQAGEFELLPETWTRFWMFVDFDNNQLSYWVGDTERPVVKVLDEVPFDWTANYGPDIGFDQFWFEFNTSQERMSDEEPCMWGRNLAVLRDVEDPDALVALGSI